MNLPIGPCLMYGVMASPMCSNAESKSSTPQMDMGKPNVELTGLAALSRCPVE